MVVANPGVGGGIQVFTLAFLPSHLTQVPVLAKNVALQGGGGVPCQEGPQVLPVLKVKRRQVRIVLHPQPCGPHSSSHPRSFGLAVAAADAHTARTTAPASTTAAAAVAAACHHARRYDRGPVRICST